MTSSPPHGGIVDRLHRVDATLRAVPVAIQWLAIAVTLAAMIWQALPHVPRSVTDFATIPALRHISQPEGLGTDTIADTYEAKVILNDPLDMYTKARLEQTPLEAATWSKAASAPYPPTVLLAEAALQAIGTRLGIGLYGIILLCAIVFVGGSAWYFLRTCWYLFPLLYLNFGYFATRFVEVQDGSYLVMLVVIMAALLLARAGSSACHALMAVAINMKLSPLYYAKNVWRMERGTATLFIGLLCLGLIAPVFIWPNYSYIWLFHDEIKGGRGGLVSGIVFGALFSLILGYVEARRGFDVEDRIGWGVLPVGMFLAMKMNVPRHLLILLLIPDKRGLRNLIAAFALLVPTVIPGVRFGATLPIATTLLFAALAWHLAQIGRATIADDLRHPQRTLRLMLGIGTASR